MLKGQKVTLRTIERTDLPHLHDLMQNVTLVMPAYGGWSPVPFAAFEKNFEKHLEDEDPSYFVIEADGKVIGEIFLHHKHRHSGTTQFGIGIYDADYVGKGYGRDALDLLLDWTFRIQGYRRVSLTVGANNERAIRAYQACGFVQEGRFREEAFYDGQYEDVLAMGLLRSEWEARHTRKTT
ncbi:MAG: GNAT family N-acetyltransferase [Aggregatilineales bacterium]